MASNWYVFYVKTGREQITADFLNKIFDKEYSVAFIPYIEYIFRNSKITAKCLKPMFPGYVFAESDLDTTSFLKVAYECIWYSSSILKLLGGENANYLKINDDEKNFLLEFLNDEYITEESKGFIIGDKVFITSGPLQGRESIIMRIDRHKRWAVIEVMLLGEIRSVKVALEIVSKMKSR